jgi:hypothetical protein
MKLIRVQSMYTMTPKYHMYKDRHMEKLKRVMRHIKLISMSRRHLKLHVVDQGAAHVHHEPHQHEQEVILDTLKSA